MIDFDFWFILLGATIALNIAPGPDVIYILTKTISGGKKIGMASVIGVCTGALFHVIIASVGLSAILFASPLAFMIIKYIGATYLLYLAIQAFRSSGIELDTTIQENSSKEIWNTFKQGVLIDILNPKVAIFFMAFLPQFVREGHGSTSWQLLYLGLIVIGVALICETLYVLLASKITTKIKTNKSYSIWLDRFVGTVFLGLSLKLITSTNK